MTNILNWKNGLQSVFKELSFFWCIDVALDENIIDAHLAKRLHMLRMIEIRFTYAPVRIEPILTDRDTPSAFLRILSNKHGIGEIGILSRCIMGSRLFRSRISPNSVKSRL
jgi:hypothetical protein